MVDIGTVIALIKALGSGGGGGGGTSDYDDLTDKPQINGVTLAGNKLGSALGLADLDAIAPDYPDLTFPVSAGQLCIHDGGLYEANDDISTSEEWTASHWTNVTVAAVLAALVSDVKVNGTSVVNNGVANVPMAGSEILGVVAVSSGNSGLNLDSNGNLVVANAQTASLKSGTNAGNRPIRPGEQHYSVFYGLAKAAGADEKDSILPLGTYSANAKAAIQSMLGVEPGVSFVETVSGTTPTITGEANVRYICGEVSTLSITPPVAGTIVVRFTSGSTATVLTLPGTVIFPAGVDLTTLDANTVYEIMITDGVYGGVMTWAVSA